MKVQDSDFYINIEIFESNILNNNTFLLFGNTCGE